MMDRTEIMTDSDPTPSHELVGQGEGWSDEARHAYRSLLRELNEWCRRHDASPQLNPWVAEHAIQQVWR